jgi:1-acyl-sn-glycerol-3-phosphate acyltransferase
MHSIIMDPKYSLGGIKGMGLVVKEERSKTTINVYDHQRFEWRRKLCRFLLHQIAFRFLAKIDKIEGLEHIPSDGPGIVMINHIAFVDPLVVLANLPRNVVPLAKIEAFHYPVIGIFPKIWAAIPVKREGFDREAIKQALQVLKAGELLLMAPEGTRNPALRDAREGVAYLGAKSGAPIIPVVVTGTEGFPTISRSRWRGEGAFIQVGSPFRFVPKSERLDRQMLKQMTDEAMYVLAGMLPEVRRGEYSDLSAATTETIEFL